MFRPPPLKPGAAGGFGAVPRPSLPPPLPETALYSDVTTGVCVRPAPIRNERGGPAAGDSRTGRRAL